MPLKPPLRRKCTTSAGKAHVLSEKPSEITNHLLNFSTEVPQQQKCWNPFRDARLIERYIKGKAHILVLFSCGKSSKYLACFNCSDGWRGGSEQQLREEVCDWSNEALTSVERSFLAWKHGATDSDGRYGQQNPMLVYNIQFVQLPSPMPKTLLVGLNIVEKAERVLPQAWYFSARHVTKRFGCIKDWEARLAVGLAPSGLHKCASEMVKRASEIMESIPQHERKAIWDSGDCLDVIDKLTRLRIVLTPDGVGVIQPEGIDGDFQIIDVLLGPIVFC